MEIFEVVLVFPRVMTLALKTEIVFQLMLPGDHLLLARFSCDGITQIHIVSLAASLRSPQDTAHLAIPYHRLNRPRIRPAYPRHTPVDSLKYKMHRILVMKTAFFSIGAQHAISHYFFDFRQIPADKVYRMTQSPIQPLKSIFQRPALLQKPTV